MRNNYFSVASLKLGIKGSRLTKVNLNKHLRSHDGGNKKECPVCKIESSTNNFKIHEISCLKKELKLKSDWWLEKIHPRSKTLLVSPTSKIQDDCPK